MRLTRVLYRIFCILSALTYGVIFSGQVLGLLRIYGILQATLLSVLVAAGVYYLLNRFGAEFLAGLEQEGATSHNQVLALALNVAGFGLLFLLVLYPLITWPFSSITDQLPWDAGLYHFPKAIEMLTTGSAWDMTIAYGEYPFGYESILALAFGLNHAGYLLGIFHALIAVYFFLAFWLLIARFTWLPREVIALLVSFITISFLLFPKVGSNPWWVLWTQVSLVGKNDLLLGAAMLAVALFIPLSAGKEARSHIPGLTVASMIALSVKPNAAPLVALAWLALLYFLWRAGQLSASWRWLSMGILAVLLGLLWVPRNLLAIHSLVGETGLKLAGKTILANLNEPAFYRHIEFPFLFTCAVVVAAFVFAIFSKRLSFVQALAALVLLLTFIVTPASAIPAGGKQAVIAWRFALALLPLVFVLLLVFFEQPLNRVYVWVSTRRAPSMTVALVVLALAGWAVWAHADLLALNPKGDIVLRDAFREAVGVDGYHSAYDFAQKNIHNAVVLVENGEPYYTYDTGFTNSVTRSRPADYAVVFQTEKASGESGYPEMVSTPEWGQTWNLIYEDSQGRVYRRKP